MGYTTLQECVADLERNGHLRRIDYPLDPDQEIAAVQRRAYAANAPCLLFTHPKGCSFPMLANLFGTRERVNFIFRDTLEYAELIFSAFSTPSSLLKNPLKSAATLLHLKNMLPKKRYVSQTGLTPPVLENTCSLQNLPQLKSWPEDGGAFITLPLVYSESSTGIPNLGMYRIQISGNSYADNEIGMHYQLKRGIGVHHAEAIAKDRPLPVHVYIGGTPALTLAAVMPLPEGMSELIFAGLMSGKRIKQDIKTGFSLPVIAETDFLIKGHISKATKPEGPFGDHMGYYSLQHDFPVMKVERIYHRNGAIWPFTTVGRPPQEDTVFGDIIHELAGSTLNKVFPGVEEVHAVDAAGVHPLLLATAHERYVPYENRRRPRELITHGLHLLGTTQTSLAKYLIIGAIEDNPSLTTRDIPAFFMHILERVDFSTDLHFLGNVNCDTLDYTGKELNTGSKLLWTSAGPKIRQLGIELSNFPDLPEKFGHPEIFAPGILILEGPTHTLQRNCTDVRIENELCRTFSMWQQAESFPLVVLVDDAHFSSENWNNFLWTAFSKSDPATDLYGSNAQIVVKCWQCSSPLVIDARSKPFHAPELEEDPAVKERIESLAIKGGPLHGIF